MAASANPKPPAKRGPKFKPADQVRSARLNNRTFPDVAEKAARNGTEWLEKIIREAPDTIAVGADSNLTTCAN